MILNGCKPFNNGFTKVTNVNQSLLVCGIIFMNSCLERTVYKNKNKIKQLILCTLQLFQKCKTQCN